MKGNIQVAIVDDHAVFRNGLMASLYHYKHIKFMLEAKDGREFLDLLDQDNLPDVVLMDIKMPVMDGFETTACLHKNFPKLPVLALSMFEEDALLSKMIASGARGVLFKNTEPSEIVSAIEHVKSNKA